MKLNLGVSVSGNVFVSYFIPYLFNNPYFLFLVSSGHNSVTVQNPTRVYVNVLITKTYEVISCSNVHNF
jgi:hypothetical protein